MPNERSYYAETAPPAATIGWVLTVVWLFFAGSWLVDNPSKVVAIEAGEFGDLATGLAGPLAFLWLVIGYYLQREELRLQREELRLQRKESAKATRQLAEQARAIRANEEHARRDVFMRVSDLYISHLIDLARNILLRVNRNHLTYAEEEYDRGSKSAYFEHLIILTREGAERVHFTNQIGKLKSNPITDITNTMVEYCETYENIIVQAKWADQSGLLRMYYLSSRMGSAYFFLCEIISRELDFLIEQTKDMLPQHSKPLQAALSRRNNPKKVK